MKLKTIAPFGSAVLLAATVASPALAAAGGTTSGGQFTPFASSFTNVDAVHETVTLPLHKGTSQGDTVYFIVTDTSDRSEAQAMGVNWAPRLSVALGTRAVQEAHLSSGTSLAQGTVDFPGKVNFATKRVVVPGPSPNFFPPTQFSPQGVADATYSPLFALGDGIVRDGSQVANSSGRSADVVSIDFTRSTVTLHTFFGFWNGHQTMYLHADGSNTLVSSVEGSNFAPNLDAAPGLGSDDENSSARDAIIPAVNGPTGVNNPDRQGLDSALAGEGDPLNINQHVPGSEGTLYTPVWDVTPYAWTQAAINAGQRTRLTSAHDVAGAFSAGFIVSAGNGPANGSLDGLAAGGFISNCPLIALN
jgi:hypothetical protein